MRTGLGVGDAVISPSGKAVWLTGVEINSTAGVGVDWEIGASHGS
jgi:2C-methyl-D-erythritol 2,4-cyclodiphosphate synthase